MNNRIEKISDHGFLCAGPRQYFEMQSGVGVVLKRIINHDQSALQGFVLKI